MNAQSRTLPLQPPYQHFASLAGTLSQRFEEFKAAQMRYVQLKALQGAERKPMVFGFDGEYSIVADPSGGSVDAIVNTSLREDSTCICLQGTISCVRPGRDISICLLKHPASMSDQLSVLHCIKRC